MNLTQILQRLGRTAVLSGILSSTALVGGCHPDAVEIVPFYGMPLPDRLVSPRNTSATVNSDYFFLVATEYQSTGETLKASDFKGWNDKAVLILRQGPLIFAASVDKENPFLGLSIFQTYDSNGREVSHRERTPPRGTVKTSYNDLLLRKFDPEKGAIWTIENLKPGTSYTAYLAKGDSTERKDLTKLSPQQLHGGNNLFIKFMISPENEFNK